MTICNFCKGGSLLKGKIVNENISFTFCEECYSLWHEGENPESNSSDSLEDLLERLGLPISLKSISIIDN